MNPPTLLLLALIAAGAVMAAALWWLLRPRPRKPGRYRAADLVDGAVIRWHGNPRVVTTDLRMDIHPDELVHVDSWPQGGAR